VGLLAPDGASVLEVELGSSGRVTDVDREAVGDE
jgi:hypothetical protein